MFCTRYDLLLLVLVSIYVKGVVSQSCREYSETCEDDKACCGGCCLDGICRDTYKDCRSEEDPCLEYYCPPDEECYVFQAVNCGGCGPVIDCRSVPPPPEERILKPTHIAISNDGVSKHNAVMYIISSVVYVILILF